MKKAIIIPIYLKFKQPEELPHLEGLRLAKRAIESLKRLEDQDFTLILPLSFDLKGFSKIRNTGLLLAQGLSIDAAIFIDSDEVIENPRYLKIACEHLNEEWKGGG